MRLATVLEPLDDRNLALAAQAGVDEVVLRYPSYYGPSATLEGLHARVRAAGLGCRILEGYLPIGELVLRGAAATADLAAVRALIPRMAALGMDTICYNFMAGSDWVRTSTTTRTRGGSLTTAFDAAAVPVMPVAAPTRGLTAADLWRHLEVFLEAVLPVAEAHGVTLAMHPDDPPLPEVAGQPRILHSVAAFERLCELSDSPAHGICFCQGTFAEMGADIPATIGRFGSRIRYVHFRDVRLTPGGFVETWHDAGMTDMAAAMRAYRAIGYAGPLRPDHVPQMAGEEDGSPGYTMLGRLFAYGYIRGLLHGTA